MAEPLPQVGYHPDLIATGAVEPSGHECRVRRRTRAFIYVGPGYARGRPGGCGVPVVHRQRYGREMFDAEFTDVGCGVPPGVLASVIDDIARRTPGFRAWQQEDWLYHCDDGCAFLGEVGRRELDGYVLSAPRARSDCHVFGWPLCGNRNHLTGSVRRQAPA